MTHEIDVQALFNALELPAQDIELLAFCASNKSNRVTEWVDNLKTTQTVQTCGHLYQAIPQVLRLKTLAAERKAMLDSLFLVAYPCTLSLGKAFLNQPLALPQNAQKAAVLGQTILKSLATGYLLVLQNLCAEKKLKAAQQTAAAEATFNALQCLALMQLRNQQLYSQASPIIWRYANTLMQVAEHLDIQQLLVKPRFSGLSSATPSHCYLRMVALAGARLNQLTQIDMSHTFNALESWAQTLKFSVTPTTFWIDLNSSNPPMLTERKAPPETGRLLHIDFTMLTQQLANLLEGEANVIGHGLEITIPPEISSPTTLHLENAWGRNIARTSNRHSSEHTAEIVVGFQQCHSKLSGFDDFNEFLGEQTRTDKNKKPSGLSNLLSALTPAASAKNTSNNGAASTVAPLRVTTQNISKEGYCLQWEGVQPVRIDAGDVIAIREHAKRDWSLGVIRWIRKLKSHSLIGVQLVSTKAQAVAASCNYDDGGYSDFMRAFTFPNQPPQKGSGLLTANILFDENTKIKLKLDSAAKPTLAKLTTSQLTTGKVKAFHLQDINDSNTPDQAQHKL